MQKLIYLSLALLVLSYGCKKQEKSNKNAGNVYTTISILSPKAGDTVHQTYDSTVIEFNANDPLGIDTVFMNVLNPNGGSMYFGYFVVNDKTLHYRGYHKLNDGVTQPKTYTLHVEAHNSSKHSTVVKQEFILVP